MSELLDFIKSTPESRVAEEVKAMAVAYGQAVAECERLKVENERLREDAERYQWLKKNARRKGDNWIIGVWCLSDFSEFDTAIDAAKEDT